MAWSDDDKRYLQRVLDGEKPEDIEAEAAQDEAAANPVETPPHLIFASALDDAAAAYRADPSPQNYSALHAAQVNADQHDAPQPTPAAQPAPSAAPAPAEEWAPKPVVYGRDEQPTDQPSQVYNPQTGRWDLTLAGKEERRVEDDRFKAEQAAQARAAEPSTAPSGAPVLPPGQGGGAPAGGGPTIGRLPLAPVLPAVKPTLDIRGYEGAREAQQHAIEQGAQFQSDAQHQMASMRMQAIDEARAAQLADKAADDKTRAMLADQQARIAKRAEEIAQEKVDPDHFWHDKGVFGQVMGLIGLAIGGALEGYTHGAVKNPAQAMISQAIDRDIEAQKANIEGDRKNLDVQQNLYAQNLALYKDQQAAEAATRAEMWKMTEQQIASIGEQAAGDKEKANAAQLLAAADVEHQKWMMETGLKFKLVTKESEAKRVVADQERAQKLAESRLHAQAVAQQHAQVVAKARADWQAGRIDDATYRKLVPESLGAQHGLAAQPAAHKPTESIQPLAKGEDKELIPIGGISSRQAFILPPNEATASAIRARIAKGEDPQTAAEGSGARIVVMNDSGQLVKTEHGFTGAPTTPANAAGSKVSPRLATKVAAAEDLNKAWQTVNKLETGDWSIRPSKREAAMMSVQELRSTLRAAGVDDETIKAALPEKYNPLNPDISDDDRARLRVLKGVIRRKQSELGRAVEMSRGQGDTAEEGAP